MEFLSWNVENHVATVTLNRPPANALARGVILEVNSLLDEVEHDDNVRVILLKEKDDFSQQGQILRNLPQ